MAEKKRIQNRVPEFAKELWEGALDAVSKTEEEVRGFVNRLVERGRLTPEEGKKIVNDLMVKFRDNRREIEKKAVDGLEKVMNRVNLPSKSEVESLHKKVNSLSRKVRALKKEVGLA